MRKEIRIYYESIEQGAHFIKPIIEKLVKELKLDIDVKLVYLLGNYKHYSKKLAPILFWKNPDILISFVNGREEIPLVVLEFSNAVFTEDHELQRFDGLVASAENNTIYVKISPINKKSQYPHGGNINFDYVNSFTLINKKYKKLFYHFDWECEKKGGVVKVDPKCLSCPYPIKEFEILLKEILQQSIKFKDKIWYNKIKNNLVKIDYFKKWFYKIKSTKLPNIKKIKTSRTKWIREVFELKLNRFGHAMDPERGMLSYYGTFSNNIVSKMLLNKSNDAWYKDTPMELKIKDYINKNGLNKAYDFLYCFMLGSGLYKSKYFSKLVLNYEKNKDKTLDIDISAFLEKQFGYLNKSLRTIFKFSKSFYIEDTSGMKRLIFRWKDYDKKETYDNFPLITNLKPRSSLDEDSITYITMHNILKPNGYKILAVSYPGAQADRVILVAPKTGRRQQRRYIDVISYLPNKFTTLQENKGKFSSKQIQREINELSKYKTDKNYEKALKSFLKRFDEKALKTRVKIGFGFWSNKEFRLNKIKNMDLKELDYFIYVDKDMKKWKIWRSGNTNIFKKNDGNVSLPKSFEIVKTK